MTYNLPPILPVDIDYSLNHNRAVLVYKDCVLRKSKKREVEAIMTAYTAARENFSNLFAVRDIEDILSLEWITLFSIFVRRDANTSIMSQPLPENTKYPRLVEIPALKAYF